MAEGNNTSISLDANQHLSRIEALQVDESLDVGLYFYDRIGCKLTKIAIDTDSVSRVLDALSTGRASRDQIWTEQIRPWLLSRGNSKGQGFFDQ